jgi:hypothetical protein
MAELESPAGVIVEGGGVVALERLMAFLAPLDTADAAALRG